MFGREQIDKEATARMVDFAGLEATGRQWYTVVDGDTLERLNGGIHLTGGEVKARRLGQPRAEDGEDEERQRGEDEQPAPAQCGHDHNGECDLEARPYRPEQIRQDHAAGTLSLRQKLGVQCH